MQHLTVLCFLSVLTLASEALADVLFDHGSPQVYSNDTLAAIKIPLGGIGAGLVCMNGKANRDDCWWIWGESAVYPMKTVDNSFFAIRAQAGTGTAVVRALQTANQGSWQGMTSLTMRGEYPFAWYDFTDATLPVKVSLEVSNPFIPLDSKNSAIPCAIYRFTVENTGTQSATVSLLGTQLNCIGTGVLSGYGSNINSVIRENGSTILHLRSGIAASSHYFGDLALMTWQGDAGVTATSSWSTLDTLLSDFTANGALTGPASAGPTAVGQTISGALSSSLTLTPGQTATVTFVLTWYMPNRVEPSGPSGVNDVGPRYANWWTSALDVARYLNTNLADLSQKTQLYHDTFYASNLPYWMLDGAANNLAILRSPTVFWHKDGHVGFNEGWRDPMYSGPDGNCTHVAVYAQAHGYLFPDIARTIRDETYTHHYQSSGMILARNLAEGDLPAIDGQCGEILAAYREYQHSIDSTWLTQLWPKVKHATEYLIATWDSDENGIISGIDNQNNTLDGSVNGSTTWLGSLYLAALSAAKKMADSQNDAAFSARCARIVSVGSTNQDNTLYSSSLGYYIQIPDNPAVGENYGDGCEIDQLFGQYWANLLGLGSLYPVDHMRTALKNLYKNNFHNSFNGYSFAPYRKFCSTSDGGLVMCSWPTGSTMPGNAIQYYTEVMTGFEYAAACAMIQAGLLTEGFNVVKAIRGRYDGRIRTDWDTQLPNPLVAGDPFMEVEFGYYYFRALAGWSTIPSCQGFTFNGPEKSIGFHPVFKPEDHSSFFIGSEGYGTFTQSRTATQQKDNILVKSGKVVIKQLDLYLDSTAISPTATALLNGVTQQITATYGGVSQSGNVHIVFTNDVTVSTGDLLEVILGGSIGSRP